MVTEPDLASGSGCHPNFEPNFGPVLKGSRSNFGSEPNLGITSGSSSSRNGGGRNSDSSNSGGGDRAAAGRRWEGGAAGVHILNVH